MANAPYMTPDEKQAYSDLPAIEVAGIVGPEAGGTAPAAPATPAAESHSLFGGVLAKLSSLLTGTPTGESKPPAGQQGDPGKVYAQYSAVPASVAIKSSMNSVMSDGTLWGRLDVNEKGDAGARRLSIPPGTSKADMVKMVGDYLEETGVFQKQYAEKFLNDKDGKFLTAAQNFINDQNKNDPHDAPYAQPILDSMKLAAAQYNGVSPAPAAAPAVAPAAPKR